MKELRGVREWRENLRKMKEAVKKVKEVGKGTEG